jgi:hypothetical protein
VKTRERMEPLERLRVLCERQATGELACLSSTLEARIYLHHGQLAWASSSGSPPAFVHHLVDRCGLDRNTFREVVDECRRARRPIGESLVGSKLATAHEVRDALRLQIAAVLTGLRGRSEIDTQFAARPDVDRAYGPEFLFDLAEVWPANAGTQRDGWLARRAHDLVAGAERVEVVRGGVVLARHPWDAAPSQAVAIAPLMRLGIELAVLRGRERTEVVHRLDLGGALGVTLGQRTAVGTALAALAELTGDGPRSESSSLAGSAALRWIGYERAIAAARIEDMLRSTEEVLAIGLGDRRELAWAVGRDGFGFDALEDLVRSAAPLLERTDGEAPLSVAFAGRDAWSFAVALPGHPSRHLWLSLGRSASLGLGWMLIAIALRQLTGREPAPLRQTLQ